MLPKVAVVIGKKGRGSNMVALVNAMKSGEVSANAALVLAPSESGPGLGVAQALGIPTAVFETPEQLEQQLEGIDWICLAGYLSLFPAELVRKYSGRILNIHPALLPKFGGKGMYGMNVHNAVVAAGETESGCTVHFVTERYDEGAIILQLRCPIDPGDSSEDVAAKVLRLEHQAYPKALQMVIAP